MCRALTPITPESIVPDTITEMIHYINKHYMNRTFKKDTSTTVIDYLIYKRVIFAKQLILNGSTGIMSGFEDYSAFYCAYRKVMECSPSQYTKA